MPPPKKRPGFKARSAAKIPDTRESWVKTEGITGVLYINPEHDGGESGDDYVLTLVQPNRRPIAVNLSSATEAELDALQKFLNRAIDLARPTVQERDRVADNAFAQGDDSFVRNYRGSPELVVRTRPVREHNQGVHDGSQDVSVLGGGGEDSTVDDRALGSAVAERTPEGGEPEDDGTPPVQPEGILLMGGRPEDFVGLHATDSEQDNSASDPGGDRGGPEDDLGSTDTGTGGTVQPHWLDGPQSVGGFDSDTD